MQIYFVAIYRCLMEAWPSFISFLYFLSLFELMMILSRRVSSVLKRVEDVIILFLKKITELVHSILVLQST